MEGSLEQPRTPSPVVDSVKKRILGFYEKYGRIPVSDEAQKAFDRVANTFQSEKGKQMMSSLRAYIPTLSKVGEGVSGVCDVVTGAVGIGFGVREAKKGIAGRKESAKLDKLDNVKAGLDSGYNKMFNSGLLKSTLIPAVSWGVRPFSRTAFYSARGMGAVGVPIARYVDAILLRREAAVPKKVVLVGMGTPNKPL